MSSVATVPTVYGIETLYNFLMCDFALPVATVPTVYGIETLKMKRDRQPIYLLQQYLPFTVLKRQYFCSRSDIGFFNVATVPTVYGIETAYQNN